MVSFWIDDDVNGHITINRPITAKKRVLHWTPAVRYCFLAPRLQDRLWQLRQIAYLAPRAGSGFSGGYLFDKTRLYSKRNPNTYVVFFHTTPLQLSLANTLFKSYVLVDMKTASVKNTHRHCYPHSTRLSTLQLILSTALALGLIAH